MAVHAAQVAKAVAAQYRIGIDLGGTKIEGRAFNPSGEELLRRRIPTPRGDYEATVAAVQGIVAGFEQELGEQGTVGVGMPGTFSRATGLVKNANSTWLLGRSFAQDLSKALLREVRCANDADCLALSEATDGAAAGARTVFAVILGTGTGAGLVVDGRLVQGPNGVSGEWGHNPLPWPSPEEYPGPACYCGRSGCVETWVSGTGLSRDHAEATGEPLDAVEIAERCKAGDPAAAATLERYTGRLARSLAGVVNVVDPDVIVLAGGMSNVGLLYDRLAAQVPGWVFGGEAAAPIVPAAFGDASGVRGAAWLWG